MGEWVQSDPGPAPTIPQPTPGPNMDEVFGAAFRQANPIVSGLTALRNSGPFEPQEGYSAWNDIKENPTYLDNALRFAGSRSGAETQSIKDRIDQEEHDKRVLAASGASGFLAATIAGTLDPTLLLPGRIAIGAAREGAGLLRGALEVGGAMAVQSTAQELALQASQVTRTPGESILNVGSATVLGALLGSAAAWVSPAEHGRLVTALDIERDAMEAHATGQPMPAGAAATGDDFVSREIAARIRGAYRELINEGQHAAGYVGLRRLREYVGDAYTRQEVDDVLRQMNRNQEIVLYPDSNQKTLTEADRHAAIRLGGEDKHLISIESPPPRFAGSAGAAATDTRQARLVSAFGAERLSTDPLMRTLNSPLVTARRAVSDLVENPLELEQNLRGQTTTLGGGPAVETAVRVARYTADNAILDEMKRQWVDLRFGGDKAPWFAELRDTINTKIGRPPVLPTFEQFDRMVAEAMSNNDKHAIPQVQAAALFIRSKVAPWADRAEAAIEGFQKIEPKPGEGYFPHDWNRQLIRDMRPEFVNFLTGKFAADQRVKQEIQTRVSALNTSLQSREATIKKLTGQLERKQAKLEEDEALRDEVSKFNKFAFQRSTALRTAPDTDPVPKQFRDIKLNTPSGRTDVTGLWFLDGDKPVFAQATRDSAEQLLGERAKDLDKYGHVSGQNAQGSPITVWFKPGEEERARRVVDIFSQPHKNDKASQIKYHVENGRALGYPESAVQAYVQKRFDLPHPNIEKARGGATFETKARGRINELADRASAHVHEVEEIENKLQNEHTFAIELRGKIEDEIGKWEGRSTAEAKSALKARAKYEAERAAKAAAEGKAKPTERLTSADDAVDLAVKRILASAQDLDAEALRARAHETTDHILSTPDGRIYNEGAPYQIGPAPPMSALRGSEQHRTIDVSNAEAWPWINQDAQRVWRKYMNTMVPDTMLAERFGDVGMQEPLQKILDEHAALSDATKPGPERRKLDAAKDAAIRDIAAMRDRLRGTFKIPGDETARTIGRVSAAVRNLNVPLSMGMSTISSFGDAAGVMMRWGMMSAFRDGFMPYVQSLMTGRELARAQLKEFRTAGIAIDTQFAARHHEISGITDAYQNGSPLERALQFGADKFQLANMLGPWTDRIKAISSTVAAVNFLKAIEAAERGTATQKQLRALGAANIQPAMYERIAEQYRTYQNRVDGVALPNLAEWKDEQAREVFNGAIAREANIMVVTPGIDKPLLMSDPMVALLTQFKSYTAAAHTRILIANLQRRDADALGGLVGALGLGMLSYKINALTGGQPVSQNPADWIKEGMSRSNLLGWFEEGNAFAAKMTRGQLDAYRLTGSQHMLSKYAGRSALDQILGPTAGKIERLSQVTGAAASMDWKPSDTHALRQLMFFQNLVYVRQLFDQVDAGAHPPGH